MQGGRAIRAVSVAGLVAGLLGVAGLVGVSGATGLATGTAAASGNSPTVHAAASSGLQLTLSWQIGPLPDSGAPIAKSSPTVAELPGGPAVVVGDRAGWLYAYYLAGDGHGGAQAVPGWPVRVGTPVDSPPSVADLGGAYDTVFVGSGDDQFPVQGGYHAYGPTGAPEWTATVQNPAGDQSPASGVGAGLTVSTLQGVPAVAAGSLGQEVYALNAGSGAALAGWPFYASDSTHSTAAAADLYGTGQTELVDGGDQTAGFALGQAYPQGGHLRILNANGGLICNAHIDQTVESSPAVGGFLAGGAPGEVVGTGAYFPGAGATNEVLAFDTHCNQQWAANLGQITSSSPALADVEGNGQLQVVEGTANPANTAGSVWVLDGSTGAPICHAATDPSGGVIGSIVTADLTGDGTQDLVVPTTDGVDIFNSHCGLMATIAAGGADSGYVLGFQNAPLVTDDPNGTIGLTLAGYGGPGGGSGYIEHYELTESDGAAVDQGGAWPMFHHDPQLTGDAGGTPGRGAVSACTIPAAARAGYNLVASDGGVFSFGQPFCGSTGGIRLRAPIVATAMAPGTGGYWMAASDGGIFTFGAAGFYGSLGGLHLTKPIVGMAATPDGRGYWLVASDGGIFAFGDARFYGSMGGKHLTKPIVGMAANPDGLGYRLVASDGGIFDFGDSVFEGSMGGRHLAQPVIGLADDPATGGYWEVASDGGIFSFFAPFYGSMGGRRLDAPIVAMQPTADGHGYHFVASDGGIFAFGDAGFFGSMGGLRLAKPVVGMAGF